MVEAFEIFILIKDKPSVSSNLFFFSVYGIVAITFHYLGIREVTEFCCLLLLATIVNNNVS